MLLSKDQKMQFFQSFSSFPNEIDKKEKIQIFYWHIINSLSPRSTGSSTGCCRGWSTRAWNRVDRAFKKQLLFEEYWTRVLKVLILTLNLSQLFRYNRLKLHFFFLMLIFQSILVLNGLSKSIALIQRSKNAIFRMFLPISKWNR